MSVNIPQFGFQSSKYLAGGLVRQRALRAPSPFALLVIQIVHLVQHSGSRFGVLVLTLSRERKMGRYGNYAQFRATYHEDVGREARVAKALIGQVAAASTVMVEVVAASAVSVGPRVVVEAVRDFAEEIGMEIILVLGLLKLVLATASMRLVARGLGW